MSASPTPVAEFGDSRRPQAGFADLLARVGVPDASGIIIVDREHTATIRAEDTLVHFVGVLE